MRIHPHEEKVIHALRSLGKPSSQRAIYEELARLKLPLKRDEIEMAVWASKQRGLVVDGPRKGQVALDSFYDLVAGGKVDHHDDEAITSKSSV